MTDDLAFLDGHDDGRLPNGAKGRPGCKRHTWTDVSDDRDSEHYVCLRCGKDRDDVTSRRNRNNRSRGNRAELAVARKYGGEKTGPLGQPEDIRGAEWRTQVKTHQGLPPARWRKVFAALDTQHDGRLPRLIERYLPGQGIAADDYIVVRGSDWLAWFGRDE